MEAHHLGALCDQRREHVVIEEEASINLREGMGGAAPNRSNSGRSRSIQAASRAAFTVAGAWQKTLTLSERCDRSRKAAIIVRARVASVAPTLSDPNAPALATAAAMAGVDTPAIGA